MAKHASGQDIDILNDLIAITLDSADGYEKAAEAATDPRLKALFTRRGLERRRIVHDFQAYVRALGGRAEDEGSILAKAQRIFLDLKTSVAGDDNAVVIGEIERDEAEIAARYGHALAEGGISDETRRLVQHAAISAKTGQSQAAALKVVAG